MKEWRTLAATLRDCLEGKYAHLSEPERDFIAARLNRRIEEVRAEIGKIGNGQVQSPYS